MNQQIQTYCESAINEFELITPERQKLLTTLSEYIKKKILDNQDVNLVYICTHNSRRSHYGQIWAKVAASFFGVPNVLTFSGGTEATAFNVNAINSLARIGFVIEAKDISENPKYEVTYSQNETPCLCFSKEYDHENNPRSSFAAIMTCGEAEANCPFIPGVELRIATTYEDPKAFDGTPQQDEMYDARCRQIARETLYVFSKV